MSIDRTTLLFFDAACLIAAAGSPSGGSGFLLSLCARRLLSGAVSQPVLIEAYRNIQAKMGDDALNTYYRQLVLTPLLLVSVPPGSELEKYRKIAGNKDEHVLGACVAANAPFLITLDKRLELAVNNAKLPIQAFAPGNFIKTVLPGHEEYPSMR